LPAGTYANGNYWWRLRLDCAERSIIFQKNKHVDLQHP